MLAGLDTGGGGFQGSSGASTGAVTTTTSQSWGGRTFNYKSAGASSGASALENPMVLAVLGVVALLFLVKRK